MQQVEDLIAQEKIVAFQETIAYLEEAIAQLKAEGPYRIGIWFDPVEGGRWRARWTDNGRHEHVFSDQQEYAQWRSEGDRGCKIEVVQQELDRQRRLLHEIEKKCGCNEDSCRVKTTHFERDDSWILDSFGEEAIDGIDGAWHFQKLREFP